MKKRCDQIQDFVNKFETLLTRDKGEKCKQVKITGYKLFYKRKINLHCHTLIFFMFIGSFTQTCLGLLEAFSWYSCFFGPIRSLFNKSSKSCYLEFSSGVISLSQSRAISKCNARNSAQTVRFHKISTTRGRSRTAATSKVELFVIIVNGWKLHLGCCSSPRSASGNIKLAEITVIYLVISKSGITSIKGDVFLPAVLQTFDI